MHRTAGLAIAALLLLTGAPPAFAQQLTLGLKGGPTFASVSVSDVAGFDLGRRVGKVIGASAELGFGVVGVRPEILLVQKGFEVSDALSQGSFFVDYIEIPVLFVIRLGSGSLRPALYGGPTIGFESKCTITGDFPLLETGDCDDIALERASKDWGAAFGAELGVTLGGIVLVGDARYTLGLNNLDQTEGSQERKNRVFSLTGGIQIPIG